MIYPKHIQLSEMQPFIEAAFLLDEDLLNYYDKGEDVKSTQEICSNVLKKVERNYPDASCVGIMLNNTPIGFFVYSYDLLISFGLNKNYRNSEYLKEFWQTIKETVGMGFSCVLYSYNTRAIEWLEKCGMEIVLKNVTVLQTKS